MKVIYEPKPGRANGPEPFPFDWEAYSDEWDEGDPVGFGSTAEAAIADLLAKSNDIHHETFMERHSSRRSSMQDNKKADRKNEHEAEHADRKAEHADRKAEHEQERAARKAQREADGLPPEPDEGEEPTQLPA